MVVGYDWKSSHLISGLRPQVEVRTGLVSGDIKVSENTMSRFTFLPHTGHDLGLFQSIVGKTEAWGKGRILEESGSGPSPTL